jgi:GMP synthase (glutamine-hydrolysing)
MAPPNKIVIAVAGEPPASIQSERGDYVRIFLEALGDSWPGAHEAVDLRTDGALALHEDAALILTGSSCSVAERAPWMLRAEEELRRLIGRGTPVLGVCFGHQLLGQALGGDVGKNPRGREISTVRIERLADDPLFEGVGRSFDANACHTDTVARLPAEAEVLARSDGDPHQCLRFAPRAYGVQFHPELDGAIMRDFVEARRDPIALEGLDPEALWTRARDTPEAVRVLRNFLRHVVPR